MIAALEANISSEHYPIGRHIKIGPPFPDHGHAHFELFWIESGNGYHRINGKIQALRPGSVCMIRPGDRHSFGPHPGELLQLTAVAIPFESINSLGAKYFFRRPIFFWSRDALPSMTCVGASSLRQLGEWADQLAQLPMDPFYMDRFLMNLFIELSLRQEKSPPGGAPSWFLRACEEAPKHRQAGVEGFFKLCGRDRKYVARTMKKYLQMTPTDYMNTLRMAHARRQLEMGNQDILDIAFDCGIENISHFYTLFRRDTGTTPRVYRLRHWSGHVQEQPCPGAPLPGDA